MPCRQSLNKEFYCDKGDGEGRERKRETEMGGRERK